MPSGFGGRCALAEINSDARVSKGAYSSALIGKRVLHRSQYATLEAWPPIISCLVGYSQRGQSSPGRSGGFFAAFHFFIESLGMDVPRRYT